MQKRVSVFVGICLSIFTVQARPVDPGESLWNMLRLVTQASCDAVIRQSDLSGGVVTITASGVYCLAQDITGKIVINTNGVVLDLNGKVLTNASENAIEVNGSLHTIRNGTIRSASRGVYVQSGSSTILIKDVECSNGTEGISIESASNVTVEQCRFTGNQYGLVANSASRVIVVNTTSFDSLYAGFQFDSCSKDSILSCQAINTGEGLSEQTVDIYGFVSSNGSSNIFKGCIAQNTLALTVTGTPNVAASFALTGTETSSQITQCTSDVVQTSPDGFAVSYGILLKYSFDTLETVTGGNQGGSANSVSWSPDGAYLAMGGDVFEVGTLDDIQIFSFDRTTGLLTTITGASQGSIANSVSWSPDGAYLATGGDTEGANDEIQVFSFDRVAGLLTKLDGTSQGTTANSVSWSPDGAYLATGGNTEGANDEIQVFSFDRSTGLLTKVTGASQGGSTANSVSWSPDGAYLATGGNTEGANDEIQVFSFDRSAGTLTKLDGASQGSTANSVSWSPDGAYLATGGSTEGGDEVQVFSFDRSAGTLTKVDEVSQGTTSAKVSWSPDGAYLATGDGPEGGDEVQVFSFDRSTGLLTKVFGVNQGTFCLSLAWSPDGAYLATGGSPESLSEFQIFKAFVFPSRNTITNNTMQAASGPSPIVAGVGISGSSIENLIIGNTSYNNAGFNYQFVTNVFDERFTQVPTLVQNISMRLTPPFYRP